MDISEHIKHTHSALGVAAEDIHKWIDGYFDGQSFRQFIESSHIHSSYNPYDHRRYRHCKEALKEALYEFEGLYPKKTIEDVFFMHLRDDYNGYIPTRSDYDDPAFIHKYHSGEIPGTGFGEEEVLGVDELEQYFRNKSYSKQEKIVSAQSLFWLRIVLPTIATMLLFIFLIFGVIVPQIRELMINDKKEMIRELAKAGVSIIEYYIDAADNEILTEKEAQEEAKRELEKMRYGIQSKDYYWIIDHHPRMLMHPYRKELVGQDLINYRDHEDKSGKFLFREAVDIIEQNGDGYLEYYWQWMDDPDTSALKMSYVVEIPRWSWILGTGVYINDIKEDMDSIVLNLIRISSMILSILSVFMLFILYQSKRIENKRQKAENGLKEAKLRYRALVEAANEGYILVIDSEITYANKKILQILDCTEKDLRNRDIGTLLRDPQGNEHPRLESLYEQCQKSPENFWLNAKLQNLSNDQLDIQMRVSKVFLSETNAHLITVRTLHQFQNSMLINSKISTDQSIQQIISEINSSGSIGHCLFSLEKLPSVILTQKSYGTEWKRAVISQSYETVSRKLIELSVQSLKDKYSDRFTKHSFAFIHLGSNARGEMTFFSDQDNALVYTDPGIESDSAVYKRYFLELARMVCRGLKKAGFDYCPGGIQASNPAWCLSEKEWQQKIKNWLTDYSGKSILEIHVFADINTEQSPHPLKTKLKEYLFNNLSNNREFMQAFANSTAKLHSVKNILGMPESTTVNGEQTMNLKDYLKVMEAVLRLYSIVQGIQASATLDRLEKLEQKEIFHPDDSRQIREAFEFLWKLRFIRQTESYTNLKKVDDTIPVNDFTKEQKASLKKAANILDVLLSKVQHDFQGYYS